MFPLAQHTMVFQLMLASRSYVTHLQFYQSNPTDKQHMTQKKLQPKTVTANMCSPQPGKFVIFNLLNNKAKE